MTNTIVIVGCGGFGREVHDVIDAINAVRPTWDLLGYVDDAPTDENRRLVERRGSTIIGGLTHLQDMTDGHVVIGIGNGATRRSLDERLRAWGWKGAVLVHPSATVGGDVRLGEGTVICAGARLTTNITLGRHVHVNLNSTVGHDSVLRDYVTVNPIVAISGGVEIGSESMLGTHSAVLQNLSIGTGSIVGAGSCVVKNVPDKTTVKGVPAR
jgi:sugar O-acyltransferase (sialic acid O-acetyltransferase NeuD family)